jgi:hypothetical protein
MKTEYTLLKNQWVAEVIMEKNQKVPTINENENTTYQNL